MSLYNILQSNQDLHLDICGIGVPKDRDNSIGKLSDRNPILVN
jgi:hypothetical protein